MIQHFYRRFFSSVVSMTMRGITVKQFGGPEVLQYAADLPLPSKPTTSQILIQVKSAGVNPVDTYIREGQHVLKPALPYTPGSDGAGIVEDVGPQVTKYKKGDRVYWSQFGTGSYAEKILASEDFVFPLADYLTFAEGAALGAPYFTAYRAVVTKGKVRPGEKILIHGASGAVGIASLQIARSRGARVFGTAGTPEGLELIRKHGAEHAFNHRKDGYLNEMKEAAGGSFDVIIEMLANVNLEYDLNLVTTGSRVVIVGSRGKIEITPRLLMTCEATVTGMALFKSTPDDWREMAAYLTAGQQQRWVVPVVGQEFPLEKVVEAHKEVIQHTGGSKGKIVLTI